MSYEHIEYICTDKAGSQYSAVWFHWFSVGAYKTLVSQLRG